jgi:hypothetical protein
MEMLRKKLNKKKGRYGELDAPMVIAVIGVSGFMDERDAEDALLGSTAYQYAPGRPEKGRWVRLRDGFWYQGDRPRAQHVSAVLIGSGILPWNHHEQFPRLWVNPWAKRKIPALGPLPSAIVNNEGVVTLYGEEVSTESIFGFPKNWSSRD